MKRRTTIATISLSLATAGCFFSNPDYPEGWPPPVTGGGCQTVSGEYENVGTPDEVLAAEYRRLKEQLLLYPVLLDDPARSNLGRSRYDVGHIKLALESNGSLHVIAFSDGQSVAESTYSETAGTLRCIAGGVKIQTYNGLTRGMSNPVAGYEHDSTTLRKANDGSLVIEGSSATFGLVFMLIPVGAAETHWIRFQPYSAEEEARKKAENAAREKTATDRNNAVVAVAREYVTKNLPADVRFLSWRAFVVDRNDTWAVVFLPTDHLYDSNGDAPEIFVDKTTLNVVRVER